MLTIVISGDNPVASPSYVNSIIGVVIVLAVLSAMWSTITGFIGSITGDGPEAALAGLIPFFIVLGLVLMIISGALKKGKGL